MTGSSDASIVLTRLPYVSTCFRTRVPNQRGAGPGSGEAEAGASGSGAVGAGVVVSEISGFGVGKGGITGGGDGDLTDGEGYLAGFAISTIASDSSREGLDGRDSSDGWQSRFWIDTWRQQSIQFSRWGERVGEFKQDTSGVISMITGGWLSIVSLSIDAYNNFLQAVTCISSHSSHSLEVFLPTDPSPGTVSSWNMISLDLIMRWDFKSHTVHLLPSNRVYKWRHGRAFSDSLSFCCRPASNLHALHPNDLKPRWFSSPQFLWTQVVEKSSRGWEVYGLDSMPSSIWPEAHTKIAFKWVWENSVQQCSFETSCYTIELRQVRWSHTIFDARLLTELLPTTRGILTSIVQPNAAHLLTGLLFWNCKQLLKVFKSRLFQFREINCCIMQVFFDKRQDIFESLPGDDREFTQIRM